MHRLERRKMGLWPLATIIFFVVCGGPYTTEQVVGKSGPICGLLILTLLPVFWSLPVGLMTAELSARFPEEGGYYVWVKTALGPFAGFLAAWWSWTSSWVDLALYPLIAVQYAARIPLPIAHPHRWVLGAIALFTLWNLLGIKSVGRLSLVLFIVILGPFAVLFGFGVHAWLTHPPAHVPLLNGPFKLDGIGAALVFGLWNYFGWDSLTTASGEVESASKEFPKAILLGIVLVTATVVLPVFAGIALKTDWVKWDSDSGYWPEIAAAAWGPLRSAIVFGGVVSNLGLFAANLLASSRIPYVLSQDGFLPKFVFRESRRFGTPWVAILIGAVLSAIFSRESFDKLVAVDLSLYLLALMLEFASLVVLRRRANPAPESFNVWGGKLGLLLCCVSPIAVALVALFLQLNPATKVADELPVKPIVLLIGLATTGPIYFAVSKGINRLRQK